ncbi:MAG: hypothetical protein MUC48_13685 [Leptolyngbya sp. Prado105]|nr:hypothetical protein [Leptolyngbya sp. Prado105]
MSDPNRAVLGGKLPKVRGRNRLNLKYLISAIASLAMRSDCFTNPEVRSTVPFSLPQPF